MDFKVETWEPAHVERSVTIDELDDVYRTTSGGVSPTFTWNDLGDRVLIVAVGDDYSVVSMLNDDTWYYLQGSDMDGEAEVAMAGQPAHVPKGAILRRETGLEVLRKAGDFTDLLKSYPWMEQ